MLDRGRFAQPMTRLCFVSNSWTAEREGQYFFYPWFVNLHRNFVEQFSSAVLVAAQAARETFKGINPAHLSAKLAQANVEVRTLPMQGSRLRKGLSQSRVLWDVLGQADLVCIDMPNGAGVLAVILCRLRRKPFLVRLIGDWASTVILSGRPSTIRKAKAVIAELLSRFVVRFSPLVFVQGQELYEKHHRHNPRAVTLSMAHSSLTEEVFFERGSDAFCNPIRVLSVSGIVKLKGLDVLAQSLRILRDRGVNVEWWCAGGGPERNALETLCTDLGLADRVRFWGYVPFGPNLLSLYRQADIFALPSLSEGVPNALLEAMANSLPVIATAVGGIPGVVKNRQTGLLVTPGRPDELAQAIAGLASDHDLVIRMRAAALQTAKSYHSRVVAESSLEEIERAFFKTALQ